MPFRFKQFSVEDQLSSMRVGHDAVLLGTWTEVTNDRRILEVGTGCGVIALMIAQRSEAMITAIDVHHPSILQSTENFAGSPWVDRLSAVLMTVQDYAVSCKLKFDHIISNPPFFRNALKSPVIQRNISKHENLLPFEELLDAASALCSEHGKLSLVLPLSESKIFIGLANEKGLHLRRSMEVRPKSGKAANRVLMEFSFRQDQPSQPETLTVRNEDNSYTREYISFTDQYYLHLT
jgi:tRNA1Val (adenine37-N6)-methyltransferase